MNLKELKTKTLALIEELNPDSAFLTDDEDIATKLNGVINQIMFELCRIKKIGKYFTMNVSEGDVLGFEDFEKECGYEVYQVAIICGVPFLPKANNTLFKFLGSGTAEIDVFVYPERITEKTKDSYEFELSSDVMEIMPYGVAADLLKSDVSTEYGSVYATRYETMLQRLDPRYQTQSIYIDGGFSV